MEPAIKINKPTQVEAEAAFRDSIQDVIVIIQRLSPHCGNFEELTNMLELALSNDGQLRLLISQVMKK